MPHIKAGDIQMYYKSQGRGFPLLLIAGLGADSSSWDFQMEDFSRDYRVIAFDNRGAGRTDKPPVDYRSELFADDAANLLQALGVEKAHVLGHSMGGTIAQQLALRHPEKVARLILFATFSEINAYGQLWLETWRLMAQGAGMEALHKISLIQSITPRTYISHPELVEWAHQRWAENPQPLEAYIRQNWACHHHRTIEDLPKIKAPTLVLVADRDMQTPVGSNKMIADRIPGAKFKVIPGYGHCVNWEQPQEFNRIALDFLAGREV